MRILLATWHQQLIAGAESYIREIVPALRSRGHEIRFLVEHRAAGGQPTVAPESEYPIWVAGRQNARDVLREVADWSADICFLQGMGDVRIQEELLDLLPTVLFAHNYHGTCASGSKRHGFPTERPCERTFGVGCLLLYFPRRCGGMNPLRMIRSYRSELYRHRLLRRYQGIVVASRHMAAEYARHGVRAERIHLNPLFPTGQVGGLALPTDRGLTGRLVFVGRLAQNKGGHHAVRATRIAADRLGRQLTLVMVGDGPEQARLEALARKEQVDAKFVGWVSADRRDAMLSESDLLLFPSTWPEPFGLVGVEAGSLGVPAVGFASGGVLDWLLPGVSGELAPADPCRSDTFADAICRALATPDHWAALRRGALETARNFTLSGHLERLEGVLARAAVGEPCASA